MRRLSVACLALVLLSGSSVRAQPGGSLAATPSIGQQYNRLVIRNALIIDGAGNPVRGPMDILIEGSRITDIQPTSPAEPSGSSVPGSGAIGGRADRVIDAKGMYVMPGIIDVHAHTQFTRGGKPMPRDYVYKLWLVHGITTIRDPGSMEGIDTMIAHARLSSDNRINAPSIVPYAVAAGNTPEEVRALIRQLKLKGAAGLKVFINRPDVWQAIGDEARAQGLPIATDMKVQETHAMEAVTKYGVRSIEHWYGIPESAMSGPQAFYENYNYDNELDRFRWAGDLWRQADSSRLSAMIDTMVARKVTWDPTFAIYEANRDIQRARTQPWFREYALPQVMANFEPDLARHGSYFLDWTTADENRWRSNYRIWMSWVREFARRGGNVTVGSDAGFIYELYGFTTIREMEMQQEAGFHPLEVVQHATANGAKLLGLPATGIIRPGYDADIAIVDGNPLHNLKVLYATGVQVVENGKLVQRGGVKYTIKKGIVFDNDVLKEDLRRMVRQARSGEATSP